MDLAYLCSSFHTVFPFLLTLASLSFFVFLKLTMLLPTLGSLNIVCPPPKAFLSVFEPCFYLLLG